VCEILGRNWTVAQNFEEEQNVLKERRRWTIDGLSETNIYVPFTKGSGYQEKNRYCLLQNISRTFFFDQPTKQASERNFLQNEFLFVKVVVIASVVLETV